MSYLFELFSLELSLKRVISGDVRFRSVVSITLSLLDVKKVAGIESTRTVPADLTRTVPADLWLFCVYIWFTIMMVYCSIVCGQVRLK